MVTCWFAVSADQADRLGAMDEDELVDWLEEQSAAPSTLDLDKQWHALHAVLTDSAWDVDVPRGRAVLGGEEVGEDLGYGPIRRLAPAEVVGTAEELGALTPSAFAAAIDPEGMAALDVYPQGVPWGDAFERRYLEEAFVQLRDFYRRAADAGDAVVIVIT